MVALVKKETPEETFFRQEGEARKQKEDEQHQEISNLFHKHLCVVSAERRRREEIRRQQFEEQRRKDEAIRAQEALRRRREDERRQQEELQRSLDRRRKEQEEQRRREENLFIPLGQPLVLHGFANFRTPRGRRWTSNQASAKFEGEGCRATGKIRISITKFYEQESKQDNSDKAEANFSKSELQRLEDYARKIFTDRLNGVRRERRDPRDNNDVREYDEDKAHETDLCERCQELGHNCTRRRVYN